MMVVGAGRSEKSRARSVTSHTSAGAKCADFAGWPCNSARNSLGESLRLIASTRFEPGGIPGSVHRLDRNGCSDRIDTHCVPISRHAPNLRHTRVVSNHDARGNARPAPKKSLPCELRRIMGGALHLNGFAAYNSISLCFPPKLHPS